MNTNNNSNNESTSCPKSNLPVEDRGEYYFFPGYPQNAFHKDVCGIKVTADEYRRILSEPGTPGPEHPFTAKSGRKFKGRLVYAGDRIDFFRQTDPNFRCPRTGEPMATSATAYYFPGYGRTALWRSIRGRAFSPQDWLKVLAAPDGVVFDDFASKSGQIYKGRLRYDLEKKEICFEFIP